MLVSERNRPAASSWRSLCETKGRTSTPPQPVGYLWLVFPEQRVPRAYGMPWSQEAAEALRRAQGQAENNGTKVRILCGNGMHKLQLLARSEVQTMSPLRPVYP